MAGVLVESDVGRWLVEGDSGDFDLPLIFGDIGTWGGEVGDGVSVEDGAIFEYGERGASEIVFFSSETKNVHVFVEIERKSVVFWLDNCFNGVDKWRTVIVNVGGSKTETGTNVGLD